MSKLFYGARLLNSFYKFWHGFAENDGNGIVCDAPVYVKYSFGCRHHTDSCHSWLFLSESIAVATRQVDTPAIEEQDEHERLVRKKNSVIILRHKIQ